MNFNESENILENSLKNFEDKHKFLSLWITLKVKIKIYYINLTKHLRN